MDTMELAGRLAQLFGEEQDAEIIIMGSQIVGIRLTMPMDAALLRAALDEGAEREALTAASR